MSNCVAAAINNLASNFSEDSFSLSLNAWGPHAFVLSSLKGLRVAYPHEQESASPRMLACEPPPSAKALEKL